MNKNSNCLVNSYKRMVKEAKLRLMDNTYSDTYNLNISAISGKSYILNSKTIEGEELYRYYRLISELIAEEAVPNAIGALIDNDVYESLSPVKREQYVYTLGIIFRDLKKEYEKQLKKLNC